MAFDGRVEMRNMDSLGRGMMQRAMDAQDIRWLNEAFEEYMMGPRLDAMWKGGGKIDGVYGRGSWKWDANAKSTIKKKGFNKPLFSSRGPYGSSIYTQGYKFTKWFQRRAGMREAIARFKIWAERFNGFVNYSAVNNMGNENIPPRPHWGFIDGDLKWLVAHGVKNMLAVGPRGSFWRDGASPGGKGRMTHGRKSLSWAQYRRLIAQAGQTARAGAEFAGSGYDEEYGQQ